MFFLLMISDLFGNFEKHLIKYFLECSNDQEREKYLRKISQYSAEKLKKISTAFISYEIANANIQDLLNDLGIWENAFKKKISYYHLSFLRNIYNEYTTTGQGKHYQQLIDARNPSFAFIAPQTEQHQELLYMDLYYEMKKETMNEEEKKEFLFKRLMKACFDE
jgi:hypothetical protein